VALGVMVKILYSKIERVKSDGGRQGGRERPAPSPNAPYHSQPTRQPSTRSDAIACVGLNPSQELYSTAFSKIRTVFLSGLISAMAP